MIKQDNFDLNQIYNADKTGLLWRSLPRRTLVDSYETGPAGYKLNKDRVTVMVCANADGSHKIPLFIIGKSKNPRCTMSVHYAGQANAWMTH